METSAEETEDKKVRAAPEDLGASFVIKGTATGCCSIPARDVALHSGGILAAFVDGRWHWVDEEHCVTKAPVTFLDVIVFRITAQLNLVSGAHGSYAQCLQRSFS